LDHNKALDGDDLKDFVNDTLFPYLKKFRAENPNTIEYKIGAYQGAAYWQYQDKRLRDLPDIN